MGKPLSASTDVLAKAFDVALLDLDGVVYVGSQAVPAAPSALAAAREAGMRLAFVTNNAARPPAAVAAHLTSLGIPADAAEVVTSSQAAAHYLAERLPEGARVLVVGTDGLTEALAERGLTPVHSADDEPEAVVQGYSPSMDWRQLAEGAVAIRRGVLWVATNLDPTVPSQRGPLPGNGSLVAALRHATGVEPVATGKPDPTMHRESVQRSRAERPLVVGDRLDTDIEGAAAVGCPSLLVLTGVTTPRDLLDAPPAHRPDFLAHDVSGLLTAHPGSVTDEDGAVHCGQWRAYAQDSSLTLARADGEASVAGDDLDPLRALCTAAWRVGPAGGEASRDVRWQVQADDGDAKAAVKLLDLD
jgi:HAD superfamily hydrolase (TIGR01450 family)